MFFSKKEKVIFPEHIEINGTIFTIQVNFFKKRSSSVSIKKNVLSFRLSSYLSSKETKEHFQSLYGSIKKKIEKSKVLIHSFDDILREKKFIFAENIFTIIVHQKRITKLVNNVCYVDQSLSLDQMEKKIEKLLIKHYSKNLIDYTRYINSQTYNYLISGVIVKNVSSKWGHCTSKNEILMNIKLLNAPKEVLDYVIFHELSHVKHKNHSSAFWQEVERFCPNYRELRSLLKKNPPSMFKKVE